MKTREEILEALERITRDRAYAERCKESDNSDVQGMGELGSTQCEALEAALDWVLGRTFPVWSTALDDRILGRREDPRPVDQSAEGVGRSS